MREENNVTTLRQYAMVRSYIEEHGYAPSLREIQDAMGQKSISSTHYHLKKLLRAGLLETDIEGAIYPRAYRLAKNPFGDMK